MSKTKFGWLDKNDDGILDQNERREAIRRLGGFFEDDDFTLDYYEQYASDFVESTKYVDFSETQDRFIGLLKKESLILDFGCGSGRDTKYFLKKGYKVEATDGSKKICKEASDYTGIKVKHMRFHELEEEDRYDGIWACSSILHLPKTQLGDIFLRMRRALKKDGLIYTSFKYGDFEGERKGRYFTDFTEDSFEIFFSEISGLKMMDSWITRDVREGRDGEKWLNLLIRKED